MRKRNLPINKTPQKLKRERAPLPWRYFMMTVLCGLFLVVGFFFAARQHFSAIDYGIKNSRLRKQIDELETEKRQLMLAKEIALSPAEIKKAAKKMGLSAMTASNIEAFRANGGAAPEQPKAEKIAAVKPEVKLPNNAVAIQTMAKKAPEKEAKTEKSEKTQKAEKRTEKKPEKRSGDTRERTVNTAR
ncbi:MAG TPA: hypothetical protein VF692_15555 [Pyrinomonadaceae bacterium]